MSSGGLARELRKNQTLAESFFWEHVRNRKLEGKKILRQHPVKFDYYDTKRFFVADFYCAEFKLIIEIDGKIHEKQKEYDEYRTYLLNNLGYKVIRFKNNEVLYKIDSVFCKLKHQFNPPSLAESQGVS
jgi:very-short-patch-repair endonuclease